MEPGGALTNLPFAPGLVGQWWRRWDLVLAMDLDLEVVPGQVGPGPGPAASLKHVALVQMVIVGRNNHYSVHS